MKTLFEKVLAAKEILQGVAASTPLCKNENLSRDLDAHIWLKREDLQPVRSYKLRGAYTKIISLTPAQQKAGVICASAGNHAQGVAFACRKLDIRGKIIMPVTTPLQKIKQTRFFGAGNIEVILSGETFDDACKQALLIAGEEKLNFIHPFDDEMVIAGQGTIGLEILSDAIFPVDYLFVPVGGGGLAAGLCTVFQHLSPDTKIIGVEPKGAASMQYAMAQGKNMPLTEIDKFVDGAAVKEVGAITFSICRSLLTDILPVPEGQVCSSLLRLYNEDAIVAEPAGALSIAALDHYAAQIKGKNVVCLLSGGNNDITRMEEIKEKSLLYEGCKHYFLIDFPQRAGALKELLNDVLCNQEDIVYFKYIKKNGRETGPAIIGIELNEEKRFPLLEYKLRAKGFHFQYLNENHRHLL